MQSFIRFFIFLLPTLAVGIAGGYLIAWLTSTDHRHRPNIRTVLVWASPLYLLSLWVSGNFLWTNKQDATGLGFVLAIVFIIKSLPIISVLHLIAGLGGKSRWLFFGLAACYLTPYIAVLLRFY